MKIHVLSDIHLEFGSWPKDSDINAIDADVTVLAGDIGVGLKGIGWPMALTADRAAPQRQLQSCPPAADT